MYKGEERNIIYTVIRRKELVMLREFIKEADPASFMVVTDANEVIGFGFKSLHEITDIA